MHDVFDPRSVVGIAPLCCCLDLEIILDHQIELLDVGVLALSPDIHLWAKSNQLRQSLFKNLLVVDLDEESQLRGPANWCNLELCYEKLFLATYLYEKILHLFVNDLLLCLDAVKLILKLTGLGDLHSEWRMSEVLAFHEVSDLLRIKV